MCSRDVQIALNPDELAEQLNDPEGLKERYDKEMEVRVAQLYCIATGFIADLRMGWKRENSFGVSSLIE